MKNCVWFHCTIYFFLWQQKLLFYTSPNSSQHTVEPLVALIFIMFPCASNAFLTHKRKRRVQILSKHLKTILIRYTIYKLCKIAHNIDANLDVVNKWALLLIKNNAELKAILIDFQGQVCWWIDIIITKIFQVLPGVYYIPETTSSVREQN